MTTKKKCFLDWLSSQKKDSDLIWLSKVISEDSSKFKPDENATYNEWLKYFKDLKVDKAVKLSLARAWSLYLAG
jgi:hypothetical protein